MNYPFYTATDDAPTPDEKAQDLVDEVLSYLGARDVARILLEGAPEDGVEPLTRSQSRGALDLGPENGITQVTIENVVKTDDEAFHGMKHLVMSWADQSLQQYRTQSPVKYMRAIEYEVEDLPRWLAYEIVKAEGERVQQVPYDHPDDYARDLAIQRILADSYSVDNREVRIELWDQIISFTYYEQFFAYELRPDSGSDEVIREDVRSVKRWHQSPTKLHNFELRRLRREFDAELDGGENWMKITDSDTKPYKRYESGLLPSDDVEEFVLAY